MAALDGDARVTAAEVREVINSVLPDAVVHACINTAHHMVDDRLASLSLGTDLLHDIELWLSAHFVAVREPRAMSERIGNEYQVSYQLNSNGMGLEATTYGQQALALDYTGTLKALGKQKASLQVF